MKHYYPTKEEVAIQSKMMALGFKVYPIVQVKKVKWSPVILAYEYRGKVHKSKQPPFEQKYLTYRIHQLYQMLYNKIILKL